MPHPTLVYLCVLSSLMLVYPFVRKPPVRAWKAYHVVAPLYTCQSHQAVLGRVVIVMRSTLLPCDVLRLIEITSQVSRYPRDPHPLTLNSSASLAYVPWKTKNLN